jgi:ribose/xylose/arabinose/galactoside ABC-type transport system permease subunit
MREGTSAARPGPGLGAAGSVLPYAILVGALLLVPAVFTRVPLYTMGNGVQMAIVAVAALGLPPLAAAAAGLALAAATAWLLGLLLFRVQGHYLALATIGLGLVLTIVAREVEVTGGSQGLAGVPQLAPFGFELAGDVGYWYLAGGVLVVAVLVVAVLLRSRVGRALVAVGDAPAAAASSGIDIAAHRRLAVMVSAVLAAGAGSLYAHSERVGGQTEVVAYGFALVLVLLVLPDGVAGTAAAAVAHRLRGARSVLGERGARHPDTPGPAPHPPGPAPGPPVGEATPGRVRVRGVVHSPIHSPIRSPVRSRAPSPTWSPVRSPVQVETSSPWASAECGRWSTSASATTPVGCSA